MRFDMINSIMVVLSHFSGVVKSYIKLYSPCSKRNLQKRSEQALSLRNPYKFRSQNPVYILSKEFPLQQCFNGVNKVPMGNLFLYNLKTLSILSRKFKFK